MMMNEQDLQINNMQVKISRCPNENILNIDLTLEISKSVNETFYRPLGKSSERYLQKIGPIGSQIVRNIMPIPGITEISIKPYELLIGKSNLFCWEKIISRIIYVLENIDLDDPEDIDPNEKVEVEIVLGDLIFRGESNQEINPRDIIKADIELEDSEEITIKERKNFLDSIKTFFQMFKLKALELLEKMF